jgi:hypothetical protein
LNKTFIIDRLVGLDASCPKHTLLLKMNPPFSLIHAYSKIKWLKMLQDMIVLDWSPNFSVFKIVK